MMPFSSRSRHSADPSTLTGPFCEDAFGSGKEDGKDQDLVIDRKADDFWMFYYKVLPCTKRPCVNRASCPFTHKGEKARRRDPRTFSYTGIACPDMTTKGRPCARGDDCPYAHNVFEYWMHPTRYRTLLCKDGMQCERHVCFFAHSLEELRVHVDRPAALVGLPPPGSPAAQEVFGFRSAPLKGLCLPIGFSSSAQERQEDALAAELEALQLKGESTIPQDDATLIELLRAVLHNQLQDGNVEGAPVHYSGPSSDPDGALLGFGPALHLQQQHALQGGPSALMGSNGFTQDDCFNQPFSDWQQGRQFGERGSGLNVLQESALYSSTELPRNSAALLAWASLHEHPQALAVPSPQRSGFWPPERPSQDLNPSLPKLQLLPESGSSYAFLNGGQQAITGGRIVDHSLRRMSDESSRASSDYPRSSLEYQRSSFEYPQSPRLSISAQQGLGLIPEGSSVSESTLIQAEDGSGMSGRPSFDAQGFDYRCKRPQAPAPDSCWPWRYGCDR